MTSTLKHCVSGLVGPSHLLWLVQAVDSVFTPLDTCAPKPQTLNMSAGLLWHAVRDDCCRRHPDSGHFQHPHGCMQLQA